MTDYMHHNDLIVMRASAQRIIDVARDALPASKRSDGGKYRDISIEAATIVTLCNNALKKGEDHNLFWRLCNAYRTQREHSRHHGATAHGAAADLRERVSRALLCHRKGR